MEKFFDDTIIKYEVFGEGLPVLFLHGWGMNSNFMINCFEPIFKNYQYKRIYVNLPGMGKSHAGKMVKTSDDVLVILQALINELIGEKDYMVVGESYGGYLARGLVHNMKERIFGMILLCPCLIPGFRKGTVEHLNVMEKDEAFLKTLSQEELEGFSFLHVRLTKDVYLKYLRDVVPAFAEQEKDFLRNVLDGSCSFDMEDDFDKPVLIINGKQDTEVGYIDQFALAKKYPMATYLVCNRAGHNLQIEQEEMFTSVLRAWLNDNAKNFLKNIA